MYIYLTERQEEVLDYLRNHFREYGIMPSTREIQDYFGFASQTAAVGHLRALEKKGMIERDKRKARAVRVVDDEPVVDVVHIPVLGRIAAGMAEEQEELQEDTLTIDPYALGIVNRSKTFALQVRGDSMIDAHILDGDYVVLENKRPRKGNVVAALIDGETTLKRYLTKNRKPYLKAENPDYPDLIPARELYIQGVMIGLIRTN